MPDYATHWQDLLKAKGTEGVDLIASLSEAALNEFLSEHFSLDKIHYAKTIRKSFNDGTTLREFVLKLEVGSPLKIDFPPFADDGAFKESSGWNDIEHREAKERGTLTTPNIRIACDTLKFKLDWPNLTPPPDEWEWVPSPLRLLAEAYLWLDYTEGRHRLMIEPTRIKFDKAALIAGLKLIAPTDVCEQKFNDLLVIALNVAAYEFGPSLVRAIEIPAFNIAGLPIYPAYLNLSNDIVTIGAGVDQPRLQERVQKQVDPMVARYMALLEEDLEAVGGPAMLFPQQGAKSRKGLTDKQVKAILLKNLPKSRRYLAEVKKASERAYVNAITAKSRKGVRRAATSVPEGMCVGLDEYFVDTLLPRIIHKQEEGKTEVNLGAVKGGVRWWFRLWDPDAEFKNNDIIGSASIDIGGAIFACVRKFWDCSWNWECGEISLGVSGRPSIRLITSNVNEGITIRARIDGKPSFNNNLPFPFDKIINAVGDLVIDAIIAILNLFLSAMVIVVVGVEIAIPNMKTKLKLSGFKRFMFSRDAATPVPFPSNKQKFLAVKAAVEPG